MSGVETAYWLLAASTAVTVVQQKQAAASEEAVGNYNSIIAEQNAKLAAQNAAIQAANFRAEAAKGRAIKLAQFAGSGLALEGSPVDYLAAEAANDEYDALVIKHQGDIESLGFKNTSALDKSRAKTARKQGDVNTAATIMSGATKASTYRNNNTLGSR